MGLEKYFEDRGAIKGCYLFLPPYKYKKEDQRCFPKSDYCLWIDSSDFNTNNR